MTRSVLQTSHGVALGSLIGLAATTACTYKVDLLGGQVPGKVTAEYDASIAAVAVADDPAPPPPLFPTCGEELAPDASAGDSCMFPGLGGCVRGLDASCSINTALCIGGVLRLGSVKRTSCQFDNTLAKCAAPASPCCITVWDCDKNASEMPVNSVEVCSPGCSRLKPTSGRFFIGCPGPAAEGWAGPGAIAKCTGNFVCDSLGFPLGPDRPAFASDKLNMIYWCENGVLQQVSLSDQPFWQGSLAL